MNPEPAKSEARAVEVLCKKRWGPFFVALDVWLLYVAYGVFLLFRMNASGEDFWFRVFQLAMLGLHLFMFVPKSACTLEGSRLTPPGVLPCPVDLAKAKLALLVDLSEEVLVVQVRGRFFLRTIRIEGKDIEPMRSALRALVPAHHVIDLRAELRQA